MNTYSRALKHISMKDVRQKHHQKLIEQKIQRRIKREERQYIQSVMETLKSDWRKELSEQMTTADVFYANLPATGDVNLAYPAWNALDGYNYNISGETVTITNSGTPGPESGIAVSFDTSFYDTLVVDIGFSGDTLLGIFNSPTGGPYLVTSSSGTYSIPVSQSSSKILLFLSATLSVGTVTISNPRFQRRTPINVFVPLDNPAATSFIRSDPNFSNLSPEERNKKLKEMIESGDEYLTKMFGSNFPGTGAVPPGEYDPFKQAPPGEAGDTPGVSVSTAPTYLYPGGLVTSGKVTGLTPISQVSQSQSGSQNINFTHTYDVVSDTGTQRVTQNYSTNVPTDASGNLVSTYSQQKADELSKAVEVARVEYLKPGQTVAQRQQSLQKLQVAIKAGTDYALGKTQTATQPQQSYTTTPTANTGLGNSIQRGIARNLANYTGPYQGPARVLGQYANNIYNSGGKDGGTITNPLSDDSVRDIISRIKPDVAPEIHKTDIKTMVKLSAQQFLSDFHLTFGSGGYDVKLTNQGIVITDPSYKFGKGGANKLGGLDLPAAGDYAAGPLSVGTIPLGLSLFGTNPPKATATLQQTIPMSVIKSANPELYNQLKNRINENHEPKDELIIERRKLKSPEEILNKIPGYYTGKPAPLGFPETPPPEMVNGMHPDLVDGKKVSDRFNRLDPESAKATPLTGNPHIDKKIKTARKKPK